MPQEWVDKYKTLSNENLTFVETDNVLPLLKAADVMLCDTSSVLQMFLLQNKPVVTYRTRQPFPHLLDVTQASEVEKNIDYALTYPQELMAAISNYSKELHPYTDGQSSLRVLNATNEFLHSDNKLNPKPLNLIRQFKMRKMLNYWGW
jgi:CDP-glycerol glycerophosphotransferase (TagB/SpsB family)